MARGLFKTTEPLHAPRHIVRTDLVRLSQLLLLCCKRSAATAAARGIRIRERESRSHHAGDVIDLDAIQVLAAEHIDKKSDALFIENEIALARILFNIQAVLKTRAAARHDADAKSGSLRKTLFTGINFLISATALSVTCSVIAGAAVVRQLSGGGGLC